MAVLLVIFGIAFPSVALAASDGDLWQAVVALFVLTPVVSALFYSVFGLICFFIDRKKDVPGLIEFPYLVGFFGTMPLCFVDMGPMYFKVIIISGLSIPGLVYFFFVKSKLKKYKRLKAAKST